MSDRDYSLLASSSLVLVFDRLVTLAYDFSRKPLSFEISLYHVDGQLSLTKSLDAAKQWLRRKFEMDNAGKALSEESKVGRKEERKAARTKLNREHEERRALLSLLKMYLTSFGLETAFSLHSGEDITAAIKRVDVTLPITFLASSPVNPFSPSFNNIGGRALGVFNPTPTEELQITSPHENTADIKVRFIFVINLWINFSSFSYIYSFID